MPLLSRSVPAVVCELINVWQVCKLYSITFYLRTDLEFLDRITTEVKEKGEFVIRFGLLSQSTLILWEHHLSYLTLQYLSICLSIYLFVGGLSVFLFIYLSVYLSVYLSLCVYLSVCLSICLSVHPSVHPSVCLSIHLSVHASLSVCLSIHVSFSLFPYSPHSSSFTPRHAPLFVEQEHWHWVNGILYTSQTWNTKTRKLKGNLCIKMYTYCSVDLYCNILICREM